MVAPLRCGATHTVWVQRQGITVNRGGRCRPRTLGISPVPTDGWNPVQPPFGTSYVPSRGRNGLL